MSPTVSREGLEIETSSDMTMSRVYLVNNSPHQLVCLYHPQTRNPRSNTHLPPQVGRANHRLLEAKDLSNTPLLSHIIIRTRRINTMARHTTKVTEFLSHS